MKATYNWLKEFVDFKMAPEDLAHALTMAGLEVKSVEKRAGDFIFEIEITSNRPDWLNICGIAREVAAITSGKIKRKEEKSKLKKQTSKTGFKLTIEDAKDCSLYTAKIIKSVKVGPSPEWLRQKVELMGSRSVNNVVDITNYVLFEMGEPLHAFALSGLESETIVVRRARTSEQLLCIDGQQRQLDPSILVIADAKKPVAIAGVMGGKDSEVMDETTDVLLEAAIFDPIVVRRSRQKLGIQTDASYRFERGIDPLIVEKSSMRAVRLIEEVCGGKLCASLTAGKVKADKKTVILNIDEASKILGIALTSAKANGILSSLGFKVRRRSSKSLSMDIPSFRQDVKTQIDLIEEIARIHGYEKIPNSLPRIKLQAKRKDPQRQIPFIKEILLGMGLDEVCTFSLVARDSLRGFWKADESVIGVQNPLSKEQEVLRPTLIPSLLACVSYNLRQQQQQVNIFEIAKTYDKAREKAEQYSLAIALCGQSLWLNNKHQRLSDEKSLFHLKGIMQIILERLWFKGEGKDYSFLKGEGASFELFIKDNKSGKQKKIAILKDIEKTVLDGMDIRNNNVLVAEVFLEDLLSYVYDSGNLDRKFSAFSRFPTITRDISFDVKEETGVQEIISTAVESSSGLMSGAEVKDLYFGDRVAKGEKNLTISCVYSCLDKTLKEEEINPVHSAVIKALQERFQAKIR